MHFRRHATTTTARDSGEFGVVVKNEVQGGGLGRATAAQAGQGEGGGRRPALAAGAGLAVFIRAARAVEDGDVRGGVPADERGLEREGNGEREREESGGEGGTRVGGVSGAAPHACAVRSLPFSFLFSPYLGHVQAAALRWRHKGYARLGAWEGVDAGWEWGG